MSVSLLLLLLCYPYKRKQMDNNTTIAEDHKHPIQSREATRLLLFSPHTTPSHCGSFGGEVTVLEKSSTDKLRKLSAGHQGVFNNGGCGIMGCVGTDCEDELRLSTSTIKRFKAPKKLFDGCSTVCHVSVPRRLRSSAMKKRSSESISSPLQVSNKLNRVADGDQLLENDGLMKSKLKMKHGKSERCLTNCIPEEVTKDEEEVVEALYALSGVFRNTATTDTTSLAEGGLGAKSSTSTKAESLVPSLDEVEKGEDELEIVNIGDGTTPNLSSSAADTAAETARLHCLSDTIESDTAGKQKPKITVSCDNQRLGIPFESCITKLPAWIERTSCSAQSPTLGTNTIVNKDAHYLTHSKNSWKRCTAHVYVCRFIKACQDRDVNNRSMMQSSTMNEAPKQMVHINDVDQTAGRDCLVGVVSSDTFGVSSPTKNATEVKNAILLHKKLVKDQQQASESYDVFTAQNQSLGFLSMPAGGHMENSGGNNSAGNGLEASTSVHFAYLQSQKQAYIAYPGPQNLYSSTSSSGHRLVASGLQVQLRPYFGGRSYVPPLTDANALSIQPQEQQQCNRPPLLLGNFEPGVPLNIPNKQIGGPDVPHLLQRAQTSSSPHSLSSLEVLGSRYAPILQQQQQQQLISATSLLPSTVKGPYHNLPSVYEANVGRVRQDNASLQIICNHYI